MGRIGPMFKYIQANFVLNEARSGSPTRRLC